jgi:hypothetical protein
MSGTWKMSKPSRLILPIQPAPWISSSISVQQPIILTATFIFLYSEYPNGYTDKDTLEFILAEPDGKWVGESSGTIVENQFLIARGGSFSNSGKYTFKIQHAMREPDLPEIVDVGFRVAYTEAK